MNETTPLVECAKCGGTNVQISIRAWVRNDLHGELPDVLVELDWEADRYYYCNDCDNDETFEVF